MQWPTAGAVGHVQAHGSGWGELSLAGVQPMVESVSIFWADIHPPTYSHFKGHTQPQSSADRAPCQGHSDNPMRSFCFLWNPRLSYCGFSDVFQIQTVKKMFKHLRFYSWVADARFELEGTEQAFSCLFSYHQNRKREKLASQHFLPGNLVSDSWTDITVTLSGWYIRVPWK